MMAMKRNRRSYATVVACVIAVGLASRSDLAAHLPPFIATYAGDTLWALMVYLCLGFVFTTLPSPLLALAALVISFSVEFSQLYKAAWIDGIRATRLGALLLGSGFLTSDLLCYTAGVLMGVAGEAFVMKRKKKGLLSRCCG